MVTDTIYFNSDYFMISQVEEDNLLYLNVLSDPNGNWTKKRILLPNPKPIVFESQAGEWTDNTNEAKISDYCNTFILDDLLGDYVVVSSNMAKILYEYAPNDIQRIPAIVDGKSDTHEVINILSCVDCIDYEDSVITSYWPHDPLSPRGCILLIINKNKVSGQQIFRVGHNESTIVISASLCSALREAHLTGCYVEPVSIPTEELMKDPLCNQYFGPRLTIKRCPPPPDHHRR